MSIRQNSKMSPLDFLYITLSIAIWILILSTVVIAVALYKLLDQVRITARSVAGITLSFEVLRNSLKLGVLNKARSILNALFFKGGEQRNG